MGHEWAVWDHPNIAIPERINSNAEAWANLIEWIEVHVPVANTARQEVQRWFLATGMAMRDCRCANDIEPDPTEPVPNGGPEYMRWSVATLDLMNNRIIPAIARAHRPGLGHFLGHVEPNLHAPRKRGQRASDQVVVSVQGEGQTMMLAMTFTDQR